MKVIRNYRADLNDGTERKLTRRIVADESWPETLTMHPAFVYIDGKARWLEYPPPTTPKETE